MNTLPDELPVSVVALNREDRSPRNAAAAVARAAGQGSRLVVLPFGFPESAAPATWAKRLARKHSVYLIVGYEEEGRQVASIISPRGKVLGSTAQTHAFPDETVVLGDRIAPIATELGVSIGLSVGTDIYFPETHWSLARQGADLLVHLDRERSACDHFYRVLSPRIRAFDVHRPLLVSAPTSNLLKLVHNEEMGIAGVPLVSACIFDQNGAVLASTGYSEGVASATLRFAQRCISLQNANIPLHRGLDVWKLHYVDSREQFFGPLRCAFAPRPKPRYRKRKIRVAILSHYYCHQIGKEDGVFFDLLKEAVRNKPDIILATEMEKECRPDDPAIAKKFEKMVRMTARAGSYLLFGGIRVAHPGEKGDRCSHAWLWNRKGKLVFESRIMLYGQGNGQTAYDTDFGRIGIRLCGDVYAPELDRLFALQGVDIVFNPSMSWGVSGLVNTELNQVRAMDNGHFVATAHLAFSDAGQRSHVIDPNGVVVAASEYYQNSVLLADINLDTPRGVFVADGERPVPAGVYLEKYRKPVKHRLLGREEWLSLRRPELYEGIDRDLPGDPFVEGRKEAAPKAGR